MPSHSLSEVKKWGGQEEVHSLACLSCLLAISLPPKEFFPPYPIPSSTAEAAVCRASLWAVILEVLDGCVLHPGR
eukprot:768222-Hanusia_phi.AAC.1